MRRPNIVFILSDDHGSWATGAYGNQDVQTPVIDKLANEGIKFDNFFCTSPVCSPARASIITGKIPSQHGVHDWLNGGNLCTAEYCETKMSAEMYEKILRSSGKYTDENELKLIDDQVNFFSLECNKKIVEREVKQIEYLKGLATYPKILSNNGYNCGMVGKWHLGATTQKQAGFDYWKPIARGGTSYMNPEVIIDGKVEIISQYVSEYIADCSIDFIEEQSSNQPFYLSVNFTAPHSPWREEEQIKTIWNSYDESAFSYVKEEQINKNASPTAPYPNKNQSSNKLLRGYYSSISAMDEQIGRIICALEKKDLLDKTIIIYTSDNGMNLGQHGVWGKGNGTYPLNFYEESIKVPFIYCNPMMKSPMKTCTTMISQYDIFPTILDICNINYEFDRTYPGVSFKQLTECGKFDEKPLVIFDEYGPNRMIRTDRYKLITRYDDGKDELYDLYNDQAEAINLLKDNSHRIIYKKLKLELEKWFGKYIVDKYDGKATQLYGFGQYDKCDKEKQSFEKRIHWDNGK